MTPSDLSEVLNRDLDYVYDIFLNQIKSPHIPIDDIKILQAALRRGGRRMRIIGKEYILKLYVN